MAWVDWVLVAYLAFGALYGLRKGLVWVAFSLAGYIAGVIVASHTTGPLSRMITAAAPIHHWVERYLPSSAAAVPGARVEAWNLAYSLIGLILFLLIVGALEFVGRSVGSVASQGVKILPMAALLNRIGGIAAGVIEHGAVAALVLALLMAVPSVSHSPLGHSINDAPLAMTLTKWFHRVAKIPGMQYL